MRGTPLGWLLIWDLYSFGFCVAAGGVVVVALAVLQLESGGEGSPPGPPPGSHPATWSWVGSGPGGGEAGGEGAGEGAGSVDGLAGLALRTLALLGDEVRHG